MQYDLFLDENDWDIYYWATQEAPSPATEHQAESSSSPASEPATSTTASTSDASSAWQPTSPFQEAADKKADQITAVPGKAGSNAVAAASAAGGEPYRKPGEGEWAQTIGTFKPAYRPVPARWKDSEVLVLLREHVKRRSMGGQEGSGMGFMPNLKT